MHQIHKGLAAMKKMSRVNEHGRKLPDWIIDEKYRSVTVDCEEIRVQRKFSDPAAEFSDDSLAGADTVAFHFMTPDAAAWWLPRYLRFVAEQAASNSNHHTHIEGLLTSPRFLSSVRPLLSDKENMEVKAYIEWCDRSLSSPVSRRVHEESLRTMKLLWGMDVDEL
ncbi:MAG: hypothetical protein HC834_02810 [Rhodospirillales bacterium]|nr:hypothetical protein [Rhodospirillales bacterium]